MKEKCAFCSRTLLGTEKEICLDESEIDGVFCDEECANGFIQQCVVEMERVDVERAEINKNDKK